MSLPGFRQSSVFGKRSEPHTVIIARGESIRHFTVRPWLVTLAGSALAAVAIGYLLATTYLVLRDDLLGASVARQARMQQAYEDRISALRAQVDRITSRQLLDQQLMESKVSELLNRQAVLSERHGTIIPRLGDGTENRSDLPADAPVPAPRPDDQAALGETDGATLAYAATDPQTTGSIFAKVLSPGMQKTARESVADRADRVFVAINKSLRSIEVGQVKKIRALTENAYRTADAISSTLGKIGLNVDINIAQTNVGGPLISVDSVKFDAELRQLDEAMKALDTIRADAQALPLANPLPGATVTSRFGMRRDPILRTRAMHSGIDLRAAYGKQVRSTGAGKVVAAGWNGGYGRMVEIDHGNGLVTRYAHLKKIKVTKGQKVAAGAIVGTVGSSGRSTGPHLHYEVRRGGNPVNPNKFMAVGRKLSQLL